MTRLGRTFAPEVSFYALFIAGSEETFQLGNYYRQFCCFFSPNRTTRFIIPGSECCGFVRRSALIGAQLLLTCSLHEVCLFLKFGMDVIKKKQQQQQQHKRGNKGLRTNQRKIRDLKLSPDKRGEEIKSISSHVFRVCARQT